MTFIYRQEIFKDVRLFTSLPKAKFHDELFTHLNLSSIHDISAKTGRKPTPKHALICAFIVMKCEGFSQITDLLDYLNNNLIIAYYCGFDIFKPLPSYWTFERFIKNFDNQLLKTLMQSQVLKLSELGIIDTSFLGLDSTPPSANTAHNNPKSFKKNKFSKDNPPKSDKDCRLGVHSASNQHNEKSFEFYWGYKSHILVDCITGLPIYEMTTPANVADSSVALQLLSETNKFISILECYFIADKGYDVKDIYNKVNQLYQGNCFIPLNSHGAKKNVIIPAGNPLCQAGLAMNMDGKSYLENRTKQKFSCPFKYSSNDSACPCNHKSYLKADGKKSRGCTKHIEIPHKTGELRLDIDRQSIQFKSVYTLHTKTERYNSRYKQTGTERVWIRNQNSVSNLNTIAHICLLAIALAAVITKSKHSYRSRKSAKRIA